MRIIAGTARGRQFSAPRGRNTRPTLDRVKESLFSILQFILPDSHVLDLFSGSGSLALESLSRGAAFAVCNDQDKQCAELIRKNAADLGFSERMTVMQMGAMQAISYLKAKKAFDIAFLDPPYDFDVSLALCALFEERLIKQSGLAILEHAWVNRAKLDFPLLQCADQRRYGDTGLSFYTYRKDMAP